MLVPGTDSAGTVSGVGPGPASTTGDKKIYQYGPQIVGDVMDIGLDQFYEGLKNGSSEYDSILKWANENGYALNDETKDYLYQQFFTEKNNESAWQRTLEADNTKYQRAIEDLKKAGLNPFLALSGSINNAGNSSAGSVSGGSIASSQASKRSQITGIAQALLSILGLASGSLLYAFARK